ncbi:UBX domain-containing protein 10 [Polymixia lowei]
MHLTRPKSSKGRSRPTVNHTLHGGDPGSVQNTPVTPKPPVAYSRSDIYLSHSRSHSMVRQTSQLSQDEIAHMLQFAPAVPALSLNKYTVLPSIDKRQSEATPASGIENTPKINLCDNVAVQQRQRHGEPNLSTVMMTQAATHSNPEMGNIADVHCRVSLKPPDQRSTLTVETKEETSSVGATGSLLLAIRAPCGRRFQQHFLHTDTLLTMIASAEARYGTRYGEAFIQTMDVPRRTFTDLDMTLAQAGIVNKSVLGIVQEDSSGGSA